MSHASSLDMLRRAHRIAVGSLFPLGLLAGCAADDASESSTADLSEVTSLFADAKKLKVDDLTRAGVDLATPALNSALVAGPLHANFDAPQVFGLQAEPSRVLPQGAQIKGLDAVVTGLGARFGEHELATQVNALRADHLRTSADKFYIESGFTFGGQLDHPWNFPAEGILNGAGATLGFDAGADLTSKIIVATPDDGLTNLLEAPLEAAKGLRGFIYPETVDHVRAMKPGEMFALRGAGRLGASFGVGAPLFVADPLGLSYRIVASFGVATLVAGQLDVSLVRLSGDEIAVEVGVQDGKVLSLSAGIGDQFGIKGLCDDGIPCLRKIQVGSAQVDLQQLVENAATKQLNHYLTSSVSASASKSASRVSLARLRFHLDRGNRDEVAQALAQALHADLRLAQALYNRDLGEANAAVSLDYDALSESTTSSRSFGADIFGINVFQSVVVDHTGSFQVETPDGTRAILFDSENQHKGWFQKAHGFTRTGVAAMSLDVNAVPSERSSTSAPERLHSDANLFVQVNSSDTHMDNDFVVDNVDALLVGLLGPDAVTAIDQFGDRLEQTIWDRCPPNKQLFDETCNIRLLDDPAIRQLEDGGVAAIEPFLASLAPNYANLVREAVKLRMTLQSIQIHNIDAANGPNASYALDLRFGENALASLVSEDGPAFRAALMNYLTVTSVDRRALGRTLTKEQARATAETRWGAVADTMAQVFGEKASAYKSIESTEKSLPTLLAGKNFTSFPFGVRFKVTANNLPDLASAAMTSLSHERSLAAAALFDGLFDKAKNLSNAPLFPEQATTFPLIALVPRDQLQMVSDFQTIITSSFFVHRDRFTKAGLHSTTTSATGSNAGIVSAGLFDVTQIAAAQ
jgi:hypothetical protein